MKLFVQQGDSDLRGQLDRWAGVHLLTAEQSSSILEYEHRRRRQLEAETPPTASRPRRLVAPIAEALGYVGGVLVTVGLVLLIARYWPNMATASRLALTAIGSLALLVAGMFVPEQSDPAFGRLRGFLWLASTAAAGMLTLVVLRDWLAVGERSVIVLCCATVVAVASALLWQGHSRPLQQLTFLVGTVVAGGAIASVFIGDDWVGLAVWSIGFIYLAGGLRRWTTVPLLTEAVGLIALLVGAITTSSTWQSFGLLLASATTLALVALAVVRGSMTSAADRRLCAGVGGLAFLLFGPGTIGYFAREAGVATGAAVWALGGVLVYLGASARTRAPVFVEVVGGIALLAGAGLTATQWRGLAPVVGLVTALSLLGLGMLPGRVLLSLLGSVGLLVYVPWAINWFFPGDGRAPLLILISGALMLVLAVFLARQRGRFRTELRGSRGPLRARWRQRTTSVSDVAEKSS